MDPYSIATLALIVSAFVAFAGVLMYADYTSGQARRLHAAKKPSAEPMAEKAVTDRKAA